MAKQCTQEAPPTVERHLQVILKAEKVEDLHDQWVIVTRGYSGDSHLFWKAGGKGYTQSLLEAGIYTKKSALAQECCRPDQDHAVSLSSLLANGGITVTVNSERTQYNLMKLESHDG